MPLVLPAVQGLQAASLAGQAILGVSMPQMATAIAQGFLQYALSPSLVVTSIDVGFLGAGTGIASTISLPSPAIVGPMQGIFTAAQINGPMRIPLVNAVAAAISQALIAAQVVTVNAGIGAGTGKAIFVPNPGASVPIMIASFAAALLVGVGAQVLATAIAQGIDAALPTAVAQIVITGAPGPYPGAGSGVGKIV
ncbi:hypothetical protein LCGC14_2386580 [marine sediment metagenome]|uniref:Uncharacterized protein n=1 Tax=marine sediment metagenome TaxID=412755 RepID=A0A0F9BZJ7_9ZZZZ